MKRIKLKTFVIYALASLSGIVLLYTSQNVQKAEDRLAVIEAAAQNEQEAIRVLKAEWAYLNNPERLEDLAGEFLALEPTDPEDIMTQPSALPEVEALQLLPPEKPYQEISHTAPAAPEPLADPSPSQFEPEPSLKPAPIRAQKEKSFDVLLNELDEGGGQ